MRRFALISAVLLLPMAVGCGGSTASIRGQVVENDQPVDVAGQASLVFCPATPDGKPGDKAYPATLNPDGTFELLASGGELPPGQYVVSLVLNDGGPKTDKNKSKPPATGLAKYKNSFQNVRREVKPGANNITFELTKLK